MTEKELNQEIKRLELEMVSIESKITILKTHLRKLQDAKNNN